mmetsp:Transcript_20393/g.54573  ORF Transcript_20393/g.54573 Transcript_20393/m.54573 type:complete len:227 (+) Transcript_20393:216-896(+)
MTSNDPDRSRSHGGMLFGLGLLPDAHTRHETTYEVFEIGGADVLATNFAKISTTHLQIINKFRGVLPQEIAPVICQCSGRRNTSSSFESNFWHRLHGKYRLRVHRRMCSFRVVITSSCYIRLHVLCRPETEAVAHWATDRQPPKQRVLAEHRLDVSEKPNIVFGTCLTLRLAIIFHAFAELDRCQVFRYQPAVEKKERTDERTQKQSKTLCPDEQERRQRRKCQMD